MTDTDDDRRQQIALFRYGVIAELVQWPAGSQGLYARIEEKAAREYTIPASARTRIAAETIRHWLKAYRKGGFEALLPKPRADRGQARRLPAAVAEALLATKEANPALSVQLVIREARTRPEVPEDLPLPPATVHRLLSRHGLMDKTRGETGDSDRRRFAFASAGELWMSDVMHGPAVVVGERVKRKTYLLAFLDDATRVIPHAAFALSENTQTFLPVLKLAIEKRGLPQRLYVDNGANYRSRHLALVCAKLGVALIHARPYRPQGKGKIERWFQSVRGQLLTRLSDADTASLEALNRRLGAWIEGEYHHTPHRGLDGVTPLEQWARTGNDVRFPESGLDLADLFLFETERKVQKDRTVSLNGVVYEVDAALIGEKVTLRFDPGAPPERPIQVCHAGKHIELARPVQTYANCFVKRDRPSWTLSADGPAPQPAPSALRLRELPDAGAAADDEEGC
jgi:transposase InsO family protein